MQRHERAAMEPEEHRRQAVWRTTLLAALLVALLGAIVAMACGWLASRPVAHARANPDATVPLSARPPGFWRSAGQAVTIAERQPATRRLLARYPHMPVAVFPGISGVRAVGVWSVRYFPPGSRRAGAGQVVTGSAGQMVLIADRTGMALETSSWAWPTPWQIGNAHRTWRARLELVSALLSAVLLVLLWDTRRLLAARNVDLAALLSLGLSLAFFDRGKVLVSVPLQYPPLLYLAGRLLWLGARRAPRRSCDALPAAWASPRALWMALGVLVAARVLYNVLLGSTVDVAFSSVLGANGIHHGLPLYWPGTNHLDAYGPAMYLSYLPFELVFPDPNWVWNWLAAAHAAAITFDVLTIGGLVVLGRRLTRGEQGTRLGLALALGWAANPWTLQPLGASSNDGLVALMLVAILLAASSPVLRGSLLGWAVAAKFAPAALAGLFCFGTDRARRPRALVIFGAALVLTTGVLIWAFLPPQGISLFWAKTLGFQLSRHSFMGIWDQQPSLEPLRLLLQAAVVALAGVLLVWPRRPQLYQLCALAGVVIIGLELVLRFWSYLYVDWYMPAALIAILGAPAVAPARAPATARRWRPAPALAGA